MTTTTELIDAGAGLVRMPFTILVDKAEKNPFTFDGIRARSFVDPEQRIYLPRVAPAYLGIGCGDYALDGYRGRAAIERKSLEDFQGTLLGWPRDATEREAIANWDARNCLCRRARFKRELARLARMQTAAVVVEAPLGECLELAPCWGKRSSAENAKYLLAAYLSWSQKFPVPWHFCADRAMAAVVAFRILEKFWSEQQIVERKKKRQRGKPTAAFDFLSNPQSPIPNPLAP